MSECFSGIPDHRVGPG